jgi:hypothetical protein
MKTMALLDGRVAYSFDEEANGPSSLTYWALALLLRPTGLECEGDVLSGYLHQVQVLPEEL